MALTALQCPAPCTSAIVATCRRDAEEDIARGRRKRVRWEHAHIEAAAMPTSQMKHCVEMMSCAPQAKSFCTKEAKIAPKLRAQEWPLRAAAKLPVPKRKITAEVSEVGQGVGIWVARTLVDCREWRCVRITLARSCSERDCGRTSTEKRYPVTG